MSSIPLASKPPQARSSGAPNPIFLVLGCTVFAAAAQVLMKFGAMHPMPGISLSDLSTIPAFVVGLIGNWQLLLGYTMHACNAFLLILALREALPAILRGQGAGDDPVPGWLSDLAALMRNPDLVAKPIGWWQAKAGCSKAHLARCCRKYFGRTLTDLLNEARIAGAKSRLLLGQETVAAVAGEVGFENLGHFHAVFRNRTGCTPVQWRRRQANSTVPR